MFPEGWRSLWMSSEEEPRVRAGPTSGIHIWRTLVRTVIGQLSVPAAHKSRLTGRTLFISHAPADIWWTSWFSSPQPPSANAVFSTPSPLESQYSLRDGTFIAIQNVPVLTYNLLAVTFENMTCTLKINCIFDLLFPGTLQGLNDTP